MRSQCGPPKFDEKDWSKFDFSRWHLDDVTQDAAAAAVAGLTEKLFNSEEWRQNFQTTLPEFQQRALALFKTHAASLREERETTIKDFETRAAAAQQRSDEFRNSLEGATAAPVIDPGPDVFHAAVRVVSEKNAGLGIPNIVVQILDPNNEKVTLVESATNHDGNAVITVPPDKAKELDKRDTTLQAVDPAGKTLTRIPNAVCIRVGQTETRVVKIPESPAIAEHTKLASELRAERETHARRLAVRGEILKKELQNVLEVFDCRLKDSEAIVAELEKPTPPITEPPKDDAAPSKEASEPSKEAPSEDAPTDAKPPAPARKRRRGSK